MSDIAAERIDRLESLAATAAAEDNRDLARYYVRLAKRIAERNRLSLPRSFKRRTCDACDLYLLPGTTAQVRLNDGVVVTTCACGAIDRYPYDD